MHRATNVRNERRASDTTRRLEAAWRVRASCVGNARAFANDRSRAITTHVAQRGSYVEKRDAERKGNVTTRVLIEIFATRALQRFMRQACR